ncbi:hypothetical protein [Mycobacterium sp. 155]|uniref:hypothetical protein n=1 Tax=Mycobacterium sp. 155 TaxID=1157943 RepID=UPI000365F965|nr:hypothetical protein [Mycobacterium sp. 155]
MAHKQIPAPRASATPISTAGISRAFVRMLSAAVESGDDREALKIVKGAQVHFGFLVAEAVGR